MAAAWHVDLLGRSCRGENVPRSLSTRSEMHRRPHMVVDDDFAGRHGLPVLGKGGVSRGQCLLVAQGRRPERCSKSAAFWGTPGVMPT